MTTIEKVYTKFGSVFSFKFNYDETIAVIDPGFGVIDFDSKSFGYEDQEELTFYPSNTSVTLENMFVKNFKSFQTLHNNYSKILPYNFNSTLTIEIRKNGEQYFMGIVDGLKYNYEDKELTIDIVDAISQYKTFTIDNKDLLFFLSGHGFPGGSGVYYNTGGSVPNVFAWGMSATMWRDPFGNNRLLVNVNAFGQHSPHHVNLKFLIELLLKAIDDETQVDFDIDWEFRHKDGIIELITNFDGLYILDVYTWIFGRMITKKKTFNILNLDIEDLGDPTFGYPRPYHKYPFKKVFDDGEYETWLYDDLNEIPVRIISPHGTYTSIATNRGQTQRKVSEVLQMLCRNFFAEFGFTSYNQSYFRKKAHYSTNNAINIDGLLLKGIEGNSTNPIKELFRPAKKSVAVIDRFTSPEGKSIINRGQWGEQDDTSSKLQFDIWLNGYTTQTAEFPFYGNLVMFSSGLPKTITIVRDHIINYVNNLGEMVAESESRWHSFPKNRHSLALDGTDHSHLSTYRMTDENNEFVYLKPVTTKLEEREQATNIEAINLHE